MNDASAAPPPPTGRSHAALLLRGLLVAAVLAVALLLVTARGVSVMLHAMLPALEFSALDGDLLSGVALRDVRFKGARFTLRAATLSLAWQASLHAGLTVREARARALVIELHDGPGREPGALPRLPVPLSVESVQVDGLTFVEARRHHEFSRLAGAFKVAGESWALREFELAGADFTVRGHARYQDEQLAAAVAGHMGSKERQARLEVNVGGRLEALAVELQTQAPLLATVRGQLNARATPPRFKGELVTDIAPVGPVSGKVDGDFAHALVELNAPLNHAAAALRDVQVRFDLQRGDDGLSAKLQWRLGQASVVHGDGDLALDGRGLRVALDSAAPVASLRARLLFEAAGTALGARLSWQDLPLPLASSTLHTRGALKVRGELARLFVSGAAHADDAGFGALSVALHGVLRPWQFELGQLQARLLNGRAHARGSVEWPTQMCTRLVFDFRALDFAHFDAALASRLEGLGRAHACHAAQGWQGGVAIEHLAGRWRGQALSARGEFEYGDGVSALRKLRMQLGSNTLDADVELGARLSGRFAVQAPELAALLPAWAGRLTADGELGGGRDAPAVRAHVDGAGLALAAWRAQTLAVDIDVDAARPAASSVKLAVDGLTHGQRTLGVLHLDGRGTLGAHTVAASLRGGELRGALNAHGGWAASRWAGQVEALTLEHPRLGEWRLVSATPLAWQATGVSLGSACMSQREARLCVKLPQWSAQAASAELELGGVPVSLAQAWLPDTLAPHGRLAATASLARADGVWRGAGQAHIEQGGMRYRAAGHDAQDLALRFAHASFSIVDEHLRATAALQLEQWLHLEGSLEAGLAAQAPVRGAWQVEMPDIRWLEEFWPELAGSSGSAQWQGSVSGVRAAPMLMSTLRLSSGAVLLPRFGTEFKNLNIDASGVFSAPLAVRGSAQLGVGALDLAGEFNAHAAGGARAELRLRGDNLALVRLPDIEADAAPHLTVTLAPGAVDLHGQVSWSRVQIQLPALPERAVATSSDEVLVNDTQSLPVAARRARWFVDTLAADLDLTLGDEVALTAAGLDARLNGAVHWHKPRGEERGSGRGGFNIVDGHYKAYGQDLKIQRGALIFDGAIDNPAFDVRAIRADLTDVVAGVRVTGNARVPKFALFAEPVLPDAEVLAYLVTGHALANASSGEAGVIARAALSLGADRAALVTSQLSNVFALDEFGINPGKTARTSSIVAGKRLTPKLTVRSEFNPFERVWTFFLNYKLTPRWSVEAQTGAGQGADVIYSVERDTLDGTEPLTNNPAPRPSLP